jgi:hypothetical protein
MEDSHCWGINSHSDNQEISHFYWNWFHFRDQTRLPLDPILSQLNSLQNVITNSLVTFVSILVCHSHLRPSPRNDSLLHVSFYFKFVQVTVALPSLKRETEYLSFDWNLSWAMNAMHGVKSEPSKSVVYHFRFLRNVLLVFVSLVNTGFVS